MIPRNTTHPHKKSRDLSRAVECQTKCGDSLSLQGEASELAILTTEFGHLPPRDGIPPSPSGVPQIEVTSRHRRQRHSSSVTPGQGQAGQGAEALESTGASTLGWGGTRLRRCVKDAAANASATRRSVERITSEPGRNPGVYQAEKQSASSATGER